MADVMLPVSPAATWVNPDTNSDPVQSLQQNQVPVTKQAHFPSDTKQSRTQKSASRELGPVMDHAHLEKSHCDHPDGGLLRESDNEEAETLMNWELPGGGKENTKTEQTEKTNDSHHVHDLITKFESVKAQNDTEKEDDRISATQVHEEESVSLGHGLGKIMDGISRVVKEAGHTVVEGLEKVAHTIHYVFPTSPTDKGQGTDSDIHVQHPSLIGEMVSLGMNIHKVDRGHLVQTVVTGGLAYNANIRDNDIIRKVNDNDVENWEVGKLQEFFRNHKSVEFNLVIERQNGADENDQPLHVTITVNTKLSFEDDQVVAEIDVTYNSWPLSYYGYKPSDLPAYFIYQEGPKTSKFLSLDNSFCGMTTKVTENCCFKMYQYKPSTSSPMVLYNVGMSRPLDLGQKSRIGDDNGELTGSGISTTNDKRFFYNRKQCKTNMYVFELVARPNYFLTVANDDTITETHFPSVDDVTYAGLFNTVEAPSSLKSVPSKAEKLGKK